ncbi:protein ANTAGONIST OF LIKE HETEROCHROMATIN PROTEIN 1-like [Tasmannia lanceolata]|uniref:protein ANTAGONIST OF LIKE HETEROCHROMATIN PROTEIN 1-like n=1 Tax=Tasmannia lanceolata TaxID=3420 RepID=UPI004064864E
MPHRPTRKRKKELMRRDELNRRNNKLVERAVALLMAGAAAMLVLCKEYCKKYLVSAPYESNYFTRCTFITHVIDSDEHCHNLLWMNVSCFRQFVEIFKRAGTLEDTIYCKVEEQVAIFLHIVAYNQRVRTSRACARYSGATISTYFNKVLKAILSMQDFFIKPPTGETPSQIEENLRWMPYFKDCIGAIDGTYIRIKVPIEEKPSYFCRNHFIAQNILAVGDFDLKFKYVLAGWEGSASDSRVLVDELTRANKIPLIPGKFYLADGGYPLLQHFITPHCKIAYHLNEFRGRRPRISNELFNHRHSSCRNVIERTFGILKKRFNILNEEPMYNFEKQIDIFLACCCIHNHIRRFMPNDSMVEAVDCTTNRGAYWVFWCMSPGYNNSAPGGVHSRYPDALRIRLCSKN